MKQKLLIFAVVLLTGIQSIAQTGVAINTSGADAHSSAILDVSSTNQGFLPPRMTMLQILAISSPAVGLMVYNTDLQCPVYFDGTIWRKSNLDRMMRVIGENYQGGIIFWVDESGQHGLISATSDQSTGAEYGCMGTLHGATGTANGTGLANTVAKASGCAQSNIAAKLCNDLVLNGYEDWYLPSKDELNLLYLQKAVVGGFTSDSYWSSSEGTADYAWFQSFDLGQTFHYNKNYLNRVRAIRSF